MSLDALRSLQKQASPGPWGVYGHDLVNNIGSTIGCFEHSPRPVDLQLAALATHLLPIAEALEAWARLAYFCQAEECKKEARVHFKDGALEVVNKTRKALKALQEAL